MSFFAHCVINVWCDQCLVWSMSFFTHGVTYVRCDQCHFLHMVWWMSGVMNVCVMNVRQPSYLLCYPYLNLFQVLLSSRASNLKDSLWQETGFRKQSLYLFYTTQTQFIFGIEKLFHSLDWILKACEQRENNGGSLLGSVSHFLTFKDKYNSDQPNVVQVSWVRREVAEKMLEIMHFGARRRVTPRRGAGGRSYQCSVHLQCAVQCSAV